MLTGAFTFDQPETGYNVGDTITATITHSGTALQSVAETINATLAGPDGATESITGVVSVNREVPAASSVQTVTDDQGRTWTQQSADAAADVWTAVA